MHVGGRRSLSSQLPPNTTDHIGSFRLSYLGCCALESEASTVAELSFFVPAGDWTHTLPGKADNGSQGPYVRERHISPAMAPQGGRPIGGLSVAPPHMQVAEGPDVHPSSVVESGALLGKVRDVPPYSRNAAPRRGVAVSSAPPTATPRDSPLFLLQGVRVGPHCFIGGSASLSDGCVLGAELWQPAERYDDSGSGAVERTCEGILSGFASPFRAGRSRVWAHQRRRGMPCASRGDPRRARRPPRFYR